MAIYWIGGAKVVRQLNTITPAAVDIGDTFTLTINSKTITYTAEAATVADVTAGLLAAVLASPEPEFSELGWADELTALTATGRDNGEPFTQTSSSSGGTLTTVVTTTSTGPNHVDNAANWLGGVAPASGDAVVIDQSDVSLLYGAFATTLLSVTITKAFTGTIGLPSRNPRGYAEYRQKAMNLGNAPLISIGAGPGRGSGRLIVGAIVDNNVTDVYGSGTSIDEGLPAVRLVTTLINSGQVYNIMDGSVGIGMDGQTGRANTIRVAGGTVQTGQAFSGTVAAVTVTGGTLSMEQQTGTITLATVIGGQLDVHNALVVTTLNVDGGEVKWRSSGGMTSCRVSDGGYLNFTEDIRPRTVTNFSIESGGRMWDTQRTVTWSNGVQLLRCSLKDVDIDLGTHLTLGTIGAGP